MHSNRTTKTLYFLMMLQKYNKASENANLGTKKTKKSHISL